MQRIRTQVLEGLGGPYKPSPTSEEVWSDQYRVHALHRETVGNCRGQVLRVDAPKWETARVSDMTFRGWPTHRKDAGSGRWGYWLECVVKVNTTKCGESNELTSAVADHIGAISRRAKILHLVHAHDALTYPWSLDLCPLTHESPNRRSLAVKVLLWNAEV